MLQLKRDAASDGEDQAGRCSPTRYRRQVGDRVSLGGVFADQRSRLLEAIDRLEVELAAGRRQSAQARERARLFEEASNAVTILPPLAVFPGDEVQTLETYATAAEQARRDLDRLKVSDKELRDRAQELIGEGRSLLNDAPDDVDCRQAAPPDE